MVELPNARTVIAHFKSAAKMIESKTLAIFWYFHETAMTKRTLGGTVRKKKRTSGFRARMQTATGRRVIKARRRKGRIRLTTC